MNSIDVITEIQQNFLDSSLDTNMNRAFPNILDGLKPGQRACLWEMYIKKYSSKKPHVKSAKVSGGVIADLWPHSDTAIYETFARMSQTFINNLPEVDWHGSNGNIILGGDALASQRYTECRLSPIVEEGMLQGVNKQNVPMIPNFSEDIQWPKVFPAIFPRLLVNGAQGIGVSISNVWLPHNFTETADLIFKYLAGEEIDLDSYYPDFPTGGVIINKDDLGKINRTGKGKVIVEGKYVISGKEINFTEMPYQVFIEPVIDEIKKGIEEEKINGIQEIYNKSDKKRILLTIECEKDADPEKVLQQLFTETNLRKQYNANQNGIISKTPIMVTLPSYLEAYTNHNLDCIKREYEYDLKQTQERIEILEGLLKALAHIDEVIKTIRRSKDKASARAALIKEFDFTDKQVEAILKMQLSRLANMEQVAIQDELAEKKKFATFCEEIVSFESKRKEILVERLRTLVKKYGDKRRSQVVQKDIAKKITARKKKELVIENVMLCYTSQGYVKSIPIASYSKTATSAEMFYKASTDEMVLFFSSLGKVYRLKVNEIKQCMPKDKGIAIGALLKLDEGEKILLMTSMNVDEKHPYIAGFTKLGMVKKSDKTIYLGSTQNKTGFKGAGLKDNDEFIAFCETNGDYALITTSDDMQLQFKMDEVNESGKTARGVIGIKLHNNAYVKNVVVSSLANTKIPVRKRAGIGVKGVNNDSLS